MAELGIGDTPLVRFERIVPNPDVAIYAKLEWFNPTGSVKDRVAASLLERAEAEGRLRPGDRILEPTSGNTGIGLARLAALKGYELTVVIPENVSYERKELLAAFGARIILSPGERGSNGAIAKAQELAESGDYVMLFQYGNEANPLAHYEGTGREILDALGPVDAFVAGLGTGGTLMGVGRVLREANPDVKIVAAEPPIGELVAGLRSLDDGYIPPVFHPDEIDGKILVRTRDSVHMTRRLLHEEGLFAGPSSGAAAHAAVRWSEKMDRGTIVTLLPDAGWKYLSSGIWLGTLDEAVSRLGGQLYF